MMTGRIEIPDRLKYNRGRRTATYWLDEDIARWREVRERIARLADIALQGDSSLREIAEDDKDSLLNSLEELDIMRALTEELEDEVVKKLIEVGASNAEIAAAIDISLPAVEHRWGGYRRRTGKPTPGRGRVTPEMVEKARTLLANGVTATETAKQLGINRSTLYKALKRTEGI
ncbi:helix-turn-helix domain-containing protein [Dermabacteraceae bacterium P13147]